MLNRSEKLWAIAWLDNNELVFATAKQESSNQEGKYSVRIFSHTDTQLQVISTAISTIQIKKRSSNTLHDT